MCAMDAVSNASTNSCSKLYVSFVYGIIMTVPLLIWRHMAWKIVWLVSADSEVRKGGILKPVKLYCFAFDGILSVLGIDPFSQPQM
jgi:hypothetical protein